MRIFVLGDIHGAYKALLQCFERSGLDYENDRLIVLGDVCDGYYEVKQCIDELLKIKHCDLIIGNHDMWALDWATRGDKPEIWTSQGGDYQLRHCNDDSSSLYTYVAEIRRLPDADTFLLTIDTGFSNWLDARCRLRGIDAPEITTALGRRAYRYVKKALGNRPVVVKTYREEKYGRYLIDPFYMRTKAADPQQIAREGIFLNQELLDLGLARLYKDPSSAPLKPGEQPTSG